MSAGHSCGYPENVPSLSQAKLNVLFMPLGASQRHCLLYAHFWPWSPRIMAQCTGGFQVLFPQPSSMLYLPWWSIRPVPDPQPAPSVLDKLSVCIILIVLISHDQLAPTKESWNQNVFSTIPASPRYQRALLSLFWGIKYWLWACATPESKHLLWNQKAQFDSNITHYLSSLKQLWN